MEETTVSAITQENSPVKPVDVPNSTAVLVLGISSIALCWCYGIFGLACGIIGLILGNNGKKAYKDTAEKYSSSSYKNLHAGWICSIIGTIISGISLLFALLWMLIWGAAFSTLFSTLPWQMFMN